MIAFAKPDNILAMPTKSNEWYTPYRYVEAARTVMGGIDLDPASSAIANETVRAMRFYTQRENGLAQPWYGRVWLNPPFGKTNPTKSGLGVWATRLLDEFAQGNVKQAIFLSMIKTDVSWFQPFWNYSICFTDHHVRFFLPNKCPRKSRQGRNTDGHMWGTLFVYLGSSNQKFTEVFSEFGSVIPANVAVRRQQITPLSLWEVSK